MSLSRRPVKDRLSSALTGTDNTMTKEFSGGALPAGFTQVPFEWNEDAGTPIAIAQFDYAALDSLEDRARERLAMGQPRRSRLRSCDAALPRWWSGCSGESTAWPARK